jgi:transposase
MRYELSDFKWVAIRPMLPNKSRGVRRVNDRCVRTRRVHSRSANAALTAMPMTIRPRTWRAPRR